MLSMRIVEARVTDNGPTQNNMCTQCMIRPITTFWDSRSLCDECWDAEVQTDDEYSGVE